MSLSQSIDSSELPDKVQKIAEEIVAALHTPKLSQISGIIIDLVAMYFDDMIKRSSKVFLAGQKLILKYFLKNYHLEINI